MVVVSDLVLVVEPVEVARRRLLENSVAASTRKIYDARAAVFKISVERWVNPMYLSTCSLSSWME